jgi:hypothetical protein
MDWNEIPNTTLSISYFQIFNKDRYWLALSLSPLLSLKITEILDTNSIPWSPVVFLDSADMISIPLIEVWNNPTIFKQILTKCFNNRYGLNYGIVFIKENTTISKIINLHYLLDNETILKKGTWFSPIKYSELVLSEGTGICSYLWTSIECFEETFYLYHLGVFDTFNKETKSLVEHYLQECLGKLDNRIRGKHVKILY